MSQALLTPINITELPEDILYLLTQYLSVEDFIAFCASCKTFQHNESLRFAASYWSRLTRTTFRVPNQPVVAHDGKRWMSLYRRMRTQTKVFVWGKSSEGGLGHVALEPDTEYRNRGPGTRFFGARRFLPKDLYEPWELQKGPKTSPWTVVADLQCGGWSTTALDSKGTLFTMGIIDGIQTPIGASPDPRPLEYPPGFTPPYQRYDEFTAIRQFSSGRRHVLGLSDSGRIWSWHDARQPGLHVKFMSIDTTEQSSGNTESKSATAGKVTRVVAGWDRSSAYITGTGIVIWKPSNDSEIAGQSDQSAVDCMFVLESWIVPLSGFRDNATPRRSQSGLLNEDTARETGEVTSWIVLTQFVVFTTTAGKVFMSKFSEYDTSTPSSICMNPGRDFSDPATAGDFVLDVQGAHQTFAVFKRNGAVLISTEARLHTFWDAHKSTRGDMPALMFSKIHCLQNTGVISMAFGDHHQHALHSDGTISSYSRQLENCGALGLGPRKISFMRGVTQDDGLVFPEQSGIVLPQCYGTGRKVMFEEEKKQWLRWIQSEYFDLLSEDTNTQLQFGDWLEEKLTRWHEELPWDEPADETTQEVQQSVREDDGLPAYFALSVAGGGWHSGALVLFNEDKAMRSKQRAVAKLKQNNWRWEEIPTARPDLRLEGGEILSPGRPDSEKPRVVDMPTRIIDGNWNPVEEVEL